MLIANGLYTHQTAEVVGSMFRRLFKHPEDTEFYPVDIDRLNCGVSDTALKVKVRLRGSGSDRVTTLANGAEVVHCITDEGRRIDFLFGHQDERELEPAFVFFEAS